MKKVIVNFIKNKIMSLEDGYAQNYVAKKELELIDAVKRTPKQSSDIGACEFNMNKALEKIALYKKFLKEESKESK